MSSISTTVLFLLVFLAVSVSATVETPQTFIVHVSISQKPSIFRTHHNWYRSIAPTKILYTYDHAVHGFAARLNPSQAIALKTIPGILTVTAEKVYQPHTTRTPFFLGLSRETGLWPNSDYADDVIIGVLDTGIWPESPSFSDTGLSPIPTRWKGACDSGAGFSPSACNRKLIGARYFYRGYEAETGKMNETVESKSPRDTEGHGTHTASTAAGTVVSGARFYNYAAGEARGMATKARIAAYKICWITGCFDSDILAAMDKAVADGVDVISLSVGADGPAPEYDSESLAVGAFGAVQKGVVVSCSAGNSGPGPYTAVNIAPWILTVGASTIDREFPADVVLGDGSVYGGVSLYSGEPLTSTNLPLIYAGDSGNKFCLPGTLDSIKVAGKIVLCDRGLNARVEKGFAVKKASGAGMILANTAESGEELIADSHLLPATMVGEIAGAKIRQYVRTGSPNATIIFRGTLIGKSPAAPKMAAFSSRGPNRLSPEILKPDVIAPGVNILAAWTGFSGPTDLDIDSRRVDFNIISGTSMACPHVSGIAALLKKVYPDWSPAAIKSALMTTAYNYDNSGSVIKDLATGNESTPFVHGAGHVDPNKALHPGLVYDIQVSDYLGFLCAIGYDSKRIAVFAKDSGSIDCSAISLANPGDLNYPSFSVVFKSDSDVVKYKRVVTNVDNSSPDTVYEVTFSGPPYVEVSVVPSKLVFSEQNRSLSYVVTFACVAKVALGSMGFGSITWSNGAHGVRSPVAFSWEQVGLSSI